MIDARDSLLEKIQQVEDLEDIHIVCMPDFTLDCLVSLTTWKETIPLIKEVYERGGGLLSEYPITLAQGGNAANTSLALARLGAKPHLVGKTSPLGLKLMQYFLKRVDIDHVQEDGKLDKTVSLEFGEEQNVMIKNPEFAFDFGFQDLSEEDLEIISSSDLVFVANWSLNKQGTSLARGTLEYAKKHGTITYFDSSDPSGRKEETSDLYKQVISNPNLDVLSANENELEHFASAAGIKDTGEDMARKLSGDIDATLDFHAPKFSSSWSEGTGLRVNAIEIEPKRVTGAGDAWNAANMLGYLLDLEAKERLLFANVFAAGYLTAPEPTHPNLDDTISLLQSQK